MQIHILLFSLLSLAAQLYYRLNTASEKGSRHLEQHDANTWVFKNVGLFQVFAHQVIYKLTIVCVHIYFCHIEDCYLRAITLFKSELWHTWFY